MGVTNVSGTGTTGVFTVNVTGLTPNVSYSYIAYATNNRGTTYSTIGTFKTRDSAGAGETNSQPNGYHTFLSLFASCRSTPAIRQTSSSRAST